MIKTSSIHQLIVSLRVPHWLKNILVFLPAILSHQILHMDTLVSSLGVFLVFSLSASAGYLLNDFLDFEYDRNHPQKKDRALYKDILSQKKYFLIGLGLISLSFSGAFLISVKLLWVIMAYFAFSALYSLYFKKVVLLDIFLLTGLYLLRIFAGSVGTGILISHWLELFAVFFFLSLASLKRYAEIILFSTNEDIENVARRSYWIQDKDYLFILGMISGGLSVLVLGLYFSSSQVLLLYRETKYFGFICALMMYWLMHMWLLAKRGFIFEDPVIFALKQKPTYFVLLFLSMFMVLSI